MPSHVRVRLGKLVVGPDKQPAIGHVLATKWKTIHACGHKGLVCATAVTFRNPGVPFRIEVTASPTFVPHDFDPSSAEMRHLAVQIAYDFVTGPA